jgi:4-diphosphocytidyl-2-C-methyl-D-erythritol kinase
MSRTSHQQPTLVLEAPAKINLFLRVISRRPDGYHNLETFMQKLELADRLELRITAAGVRLSCPGSSLPCDEDNLAYRAAALFLQRAAVENGVEIVLHKRIPIAAGLGGGSSDAAAILVGLNRLFAPGLSEEALFQLAGSLGADVPFFVANAAAALATGIGDRLQPAKPLKRCRVLLVNPGFAVSTKWVYENLALTMPGNPYILGRDQTRDNYLEFLPSSQPLTASNDLETVTIERFPELGEIKEGLLAAGAGVALMSGSGPTVFGLFSEEGLAVNCYEHFWRRYPQNVFLTSPRRML